MKQQAMPRRADLEVGGGLTDDAKVVDGEGRCALLDGHVLGEALAGLAPALAALDAHDLLDKVLKDAVGVFGATAVLRVELDAPHHGTLLAQLRTDDALDRRVVGVDKPRLPALGPLALVGRQRVAVVLRGDVDATALDKVARRLERHDGLVVATVAKLHAVRLDAGRNADHLMTHADSEDGTVPLGDGGAGHVERGLDRVGRAGAVGEEETVEAVAHLVEVKVPGEHGDRGAAAEEGAQDVGLAAKVHEGDVASGGLGTADGVEDVGLLGGHLCDEVLGHGVDVVGEGGRLVVAVADEDGAEGGALVAEERGDGAGVDAEEAGDVVARTPGGEGLLGEVVGEALGEVGDDDAGGLHLVGLEEGADVDVCGVLDGRLSVGVVGHAVVAHEGLGEGEDLALVRGVGERLGVRGDRGGEDGLAKDAAGSTERAAGERVAGLEVQGGRLGGRRLGVGDGDRGVRGKRANRSAADERRHGGALERHVAEGSQHGCELVDGITDVVVPGLLNEHALHSPFVFGRQNLNVLRVGRGRERRTVQCGRKDKRQELGLWLAGAWILVESSRQSAAPHQSRFGFFSSHFTPTALCCPIAVLDPKWRTDTLYSSSAENFPKKPRSGWVDSTSPE
ncbi:hypothetical protein L1887_59695 [Cichorium endivia]|nr:hypothetical protein L1887_59695 [Cichorium endivia]